MTRVLISSEKSEQNMGVRSEVLVLTMKLRNNCPAIKQHQVMSDTFMTDRVSASDAAAPAIIQPGRGREFNVVAGKREG